MKIKVILYGVLIISWASLFKLDKFSFKRYLPVGILTAFLYTILSAINEKTKWWVVKKSILPKLPSNFPFAFGPFIFLPIWLFKLTLGRFWLYLTINIGLGIFFAYPLTTLFEKVNIYKMKNMSRIQLVFLSVSSSVILYLYQVFLEEVLKPITNKQKHGKMTTK
ncbi:hypothetical protein WQ54_20840 [Bacillus sp. SA1-12]|uniref:hypothetical protein n=1 Tax=Bacillus sp. SA1-12 TaxID=1455638 RepID=UPI0006271FCF|nr:hypothetical protein [Bacillus sp. SA1-12]KKI90408.1 hypothetical protein WQ54_20840 [Bacillus sp. SA1-12]